MHAGRCLYGLLVMGVILVGAFPTARANASYADLFASSLKVDGWQAEQLARTLGQEFRAAPGLFLRALAVAPQEQVRQVATFLVYDASYGDLGAFGKELKRLGVDLGVQGPELAALGEILGALDRYEAELEKVRHSSELPPPKTPAMVFSPEILLQLISAQRASGRGLEHTVDEEFFELLAHAYRADPELFAKTIARLPDPEVRFLCRMVARHVARPGEEVARPRGAWELTPREKEILESIRNITPPDVVPRAKPGRPTRHL
jgi:hypothetical protein